MGWLQTKRRRTGRPDPQANRMPCAGLPSNELSAAGTRASSSCACLQPLTSCYILPRCLQKYGYNIPANMYAAGALRRLLALNTAVWGSAEVERRAGQLLQDIRQGLNKWGTTTAPDGSKVYAYEVRRDVVSASGPVAARKRCCRHWSPVKQGGCLHLSNYWQQHGLQPGGGCHLGGVEGSPSKHNSKDAPTHHPRLPLSSTRVLSACRLTVVALLWLHCCLLSAA
jgi:hypothetical protein